MENKDDIVQPFERKGKVVYELAADGMCEFEDEERIQVCRGVLAFHSEFFMETFFGSESETKIKIKGFDRASFKTFLDCLLGMKEYTLLDALLIYPIAHQFKVKESLDKCAAVLKPEEMSENVSHVLNLTTFYECNELTDYVIDFVKTKYGIVNFLENKEYSFLLEPLAVIKLIENVGVNSLIWTLVYQWGENYLKKREKSEIKSFFVENGIFEKISLAHFESAKAIINFHVMSNKQLFCSDEILCHLEMNSLTFHQKLPDRSDWVIINSGCSFTETIVFKNLILLGTKEEQLDLTICISPNKILIEPKNSISSALKVKARYILRGILKDVKINYGIVTLPVWRSDLNFFYREKFDSSMYEFFHTPFSQSDEFDMGLCFEDLLPDDDVSYTPSYKSLIHAPVQSLEICSVEIIYNFNCPCRILKTSLDTQENLVGDNNSYFTSNVSILKSY